MAAPKPRRASPKNRSLAQPGDRDPKTFTPEQKLLILDVWKRSNLSGTEFAPLLGISKNTLYIWRKKFELEGAEGLFGRPRGAPKGSRVDPVTRRAILLIKEGNPDYGCERISQMLYRGPGLGVSPSAVSLVLHEEGLQPKETRTQPHPDKKRRFERAGPNQLWQTDMFTFILKRSSHRVHLVAFLDDHSRFITGYGLASSPTSAFVLEVVRTAIGSFGYPEEILTDQGPQYHSWRGKSAFLREMEKKGIRQVLARAQHPQTLGKIERFWGSLWRECLEGAVMTDINDARKRIGLYIDHYNFQRTHQGIEGMVPADRFFGAESEIRKTLEQRVAANALEIARHGEPGKTFYLSGRVGDVGLSLHAEGEKVVLTTEDGRREEVALAGSEAPVAPEGRPLHEMEPEKEPLPPGASPLDQGLDDLKKAGVELYAEREVEHGEG